MRGLHNSLLLIPALLGMVAGAPVELAFCPTNGALPTCDHMFHECPFNSSYPDLDTLIITNILKSIEQIDNICSNLDSYGHLMSCAKPALASCRDTTTRRLQLVPDLSKWLAALSYLCHTNRNFTCDGSSSGLVAPCLRRIVNSTKTLDLTGDDTSFIAHYCRVYIATFNCLKMAVIGCSESGPSVIAQLMEGYRPIPCEFNETATTTKTIATSETSSAFRINQSHFAMFVYVISVSLTALS